MELGDLATKVNAVLKQWLQAINSQDVDSLQNLCSANHVFFVDGESPKVGKQRNRAAVLGYFELYPEYSVYVDEYYDRPDAHYIVGHTTGSHVDTMLEQIPSSVIWRCQTKAGTVTEWSIYEASIENRRRFNLQGTGDSPFTNPGLRRPSWD